MSNRGYDVVVDVDAEGDLGHTDLQEDNLEFHSSNFADPTQTNAKPPPPPNGSSKHYRSASSSALGSRRYLWSISFYAQFFDVDTNEVLRRCWAALYPRSNFLDVLDGNPDLYGPFWISTTVVVILFLTGTMNWGLAERGSGKFGYDFGLLSGSAGLIYGYTLIIPLILYFLLRYFSTSSTSPSFTDPSPSSSSPGSAAAAASLLETWALYGYANLIWIPVALISWSPSDILNYVFVGLGFAASAFFLARNLWPVIATTPSHRAKVLLVLVVVAHVGLAIAIKFLFFAHKSPAANKSKLPSGDGSDKSAAGPKIGADDGEGEGEEVALRLLARGVLGF